MAKLIAAQYLANFQNLSKSTITIEIVKFALSLNPDNLSKQDLNDINNDLSNGIDVAISQNKRALESQPKNLRQYQEIEGALLKLETTQGRLYAAWISTELDSILTDEPSGAKAKILKATGNLQKAKIDLQKIEKFLSFIDKLTKLISIIVSAIQAPSLASISSVLQQLDALE